MPDTEAYIKAGYTKSIANAKKNAWRMRGSEGIEARIAALRAPEKESTLRRKDDNLRFLCEVIATPISEIGPDSPLCVEYTEEVIAGGSRGKLKRGNAPSGNETVGETILRRKVKKSDPLRALEIYNRMLGHNEPDRTEIEVGPKTLLSIRERAGQVSSALAGKYGSKA